jgi:hypothetical protein
VSEFEGFCSSLADAVILSYAIADLNMFLDKRNFYSIQGFYIVAMFFLNSAQVLALELLRHIQTQGTRIIKLRASLYSINWFELQEKTYLK